MRRSKDEGGGGREGGGGGSPRGKCKSRASTFKGPRAPVGAADTLVKNRFRPILGATSKQAIGPVCFFKLLYYVA